MTDAQDKPLSEDARILLDAIKGIFSTEALDRHFKVAVPPNLVAAAQELLARGLLEDAGQGQYLLSEAQYALARLN